MSTRVRRLYVLCADVPERIRLEMAAWPRLRLVPLGAARLRYRAHGWLDAHRPQLTVVHDTFGFLADWMGARRGGPPWCFTTQFSSNARWLDGVRRRPGMGFDLRYAGLRAVTFWRDRRVAAAADRVLVLGVGHAEAFRAFHGGVPAARFRRVPSEVDTARFTPPRARPAGPPLLLYTGRIQRSKGLDVLLRAFAEVARGPTSPGARLRLLGRVEPMDQAWFDAEVALSGLEPPTLQLPGAVPPETMAAQYRGADLFVSPSLFEGSPRSVREALASGCRAVLSDIPGHRALDPEGRFIRFVPVDDVAGWGRALTAALSEPAGEAERRRRAGVAHMQTVHSLQAVADRLLATYAEVMAEPG